MTRSFTWVTGSFLTNLGFVRMFVDGSMMTRLFMTHNFSTGCRWTQKLNKEDDGVTGLTSTGVLLTGYFLLLLKSKHCWKTTNYTSIGYVYPILVWHESTWHIPLSSDLRTTTMSPWQLSPFFLRLDDMIFIFPLNQRNLERNFDHVWRGESTGNIQGWSVLWLQVENILPSTVEHHPDTHHNSFYTGVKRTVMGFSFFVYGLRAGVNRILMGFSFFFYGFLGNSWNRDFFWRSVKTWNWKKNL